MTQSIEDIRAKLTDRQAKFIEEYSKGEISKVDAYRQAGYQAKTDNAAYVGASRLLNNDKTIAYLQALQRRQQARSGISRTQIVNKLMHSYEQAMSNNQVSAAVSALAQVSKICGYDTESAPNPERQRAQQQLEQSERQRLQRLARQATGEDAGQYPRLAKDG